MPGKTKILIAASSAVGEPAVRHWLGSIQDHWPAGTIYLEGNPALGKVLRDSGADVLPVSAKSAVGYKKIISEVSHLVLLWDGDDLARLLFEARMAKIKTKVIPVAVTKVVNKKLTDQYDVYIGRGSPWGNPFAIAHGDGPDRAEVIRRYREYFDEKIETDNAFKNGVLSMKGMRLACFCKPDACHGDVIAEYLNNIFDDLDGEGKNE